MLEHHIRGRGISDARVLDAMESVPRELFLPADQRHHAYEDRALPLACGQTVSQPYIVAAMTEALDLRPGDRVLEVGTGSGYQAAVLAHMEARVYSVERLRRLAEEARVRLDRVGAENVRLKVGDGTLGWPEEAPFDAVVVTAAAPSPPAALLDQLSPEGGRLVIPVGDRWLQELTKIVRDGARYTHESLMGCRFVPLVGEQGWES
jgi:protein-L-isoaspartate(D-aspartate) O-methyltransferase